MAKTVYFGNATHAAFIKAPQSGMDASPTGYASRISFLNGGSSVRRSNQTARQFNMSWSGQMNGSDSSEDLQVIKDFYDGLYGVGPFYWCDPYAMGSNLLAPNWAAPRLGELDWASLSATVTPTFTAAAYANGFPSTYATYALPGNHADALSYTLIIPAGYTLHFGWHSTSAGVSAASAAGIRITPYDSSGTAGTVINPNSLLAGGTTRTNVTVSGDSYSSVKIRLANGSGSSSSVNVVGMIAQLLPDGASVATGGFISGRGSGAIEFTEAPKMTYISSAINNGFFEMSASFIEVK